MKLKLVSTLTILFLFHIVGWSQSIQMRVCTNDGQVHVFSIDEIRMLTFGVPPNVNNQKFNAVIKNFSLLKCYPNPFNTSLAINYSLHIEGTVSVSINDLNGKAIRSMYEGSQSKGNYVLAWDGITNSGSRAQPGIYICTIKFNNQIQTNKIVLIK